MARPGPAAAARKLGRTANAEWTEIANEPFTGPSPDLPDFQTWHPMVINWWAHLRSMPHCARWQATDWDYALETAFMKQRYWERFFDGDESSTAAVDLRRREDQMGTTEEARRKLRIRYVDVYEDAPPEIGDDAGVPVVVQRQARAGGPRPVTDLTSRRARAMAEQRQATGTE
jgi:hypothetical protein